MFGFGLVLWSCVAWTWLGRRRDRSRRRGARMSVATRLQAMQPTDVGVPGPTSWDMARAFRSIRADPLTFLGEVSQHYGDTVSFPVPGAPALLLNDPADVRHVLQTSARSWGKDTVQYAALARVTGPGLLASAEPSWIDHRRLAAPAFHHQRLEAVGDEVRRGRPHRHRGATGRTARRRGRGRRGRRRRRPDPHHRPRRGRPRALQHRPVRPGPRPAGGHERGRRPGGAARPLDPPPRRVDPDPDQPPAALRPAPPRRRRRRDHRRAAGPQRPRRRDAPPRRRPPRAAARQRHGRRRDPRRARHHGHRRPRDRGGCARLDPHAAGGAPGGAGARALRARRPSRARSRSSGTASACRGRARSSTRRCASTHRPGPSPAARTATTRSAGGQVPAGTLAIISPWLVHRRPDLWPEPEAFRPERFLDGTARTGYLPFGQGPRLCIGREFALGEMVVVLAELLREHRIDVPGGPGGWTRPVAEAKVAVHPRGGMPLVVRRTGTP